MPSREVNFISGRWKGESLLPKGCGFNLFNSTRVLGVLAEPQVVWLTRLGSGITNFVTTDDANFVSSGMGPDSHGHV